MMLGLLPLLSLAASALATPMLGARTTPRPLVLWHGLGDSHSSPGMLEFAELIKDIHPGIFIHSVYIEEDLREDQRAGFYGNANTQGELVAAQLANLTELRDGFDAIGFSQGGQFLRAYVERHNNPPVRNLVTFGAQHMGVSDLPACRPGDWTCQLARRAARGGVYRRWAQENLVQAQYFRDPARYATYLSTNTFLAAINNELAAARNATFKANFASLENLVLVLFAQDKTVVPKESSWFGSEAIPEDPAAHGEDGGRSDADADVDMGPQAPMRWPRADPPTMVPMRLQPLYTEDWIGLRALDERGAVHLETCAGEHMQMPDECWEWIVRKFCGSPVKAA